ncbi:MAG: UbiA family prenyltransferase [Phycisphaeraceae bacterium]
MFQPWRQVVGLIQLTRFALALAVVSNCWLTVFIARNFEPLEGRSQVLMELPLLVALLLAAAVAGGLHIYGFALNDVLDARHDRLFSPHRPIPAGQVRRSSAVIVAVVGLLAAILAAAFLGQVAVLLCILAALGVLFFNATGKFLPAAGIFALAIIRALSMLIPNPPLGFIWPIWLMVTHIMATTALGHILEEKRPRLTKGEIAWLATAWAFVTAGMVVYMIWRSTILAYGRPFIWIGPAIAGGLFILISAIMVRQADEPGAPRRVIGRQYMRLSILWLVVYDAAWLFAAGLFWPGMLHLVLFSSVYIALYVMGPLRAAMGPKPGYRLDGQA